MASASRRRRHVLVLLVVALVLSACGDSRQPSEARWRNLTIPLPDGWYLFEDEDTRLSISNRDLGVDAADRGVDDQDAPTVAMWFTYVPDTLPADWRAWAESVDATIESDQQIQLDGDVPATRLVYRFETLGVHTREMVVVIPSRQIVVLANPVFGPGDDDVRELFVDHFEDFSAVLDGITLGSPVLD